MEPAPVLPVELPTRDVDSPGHSNPPTSPAVKAYCDVCEEDFDWEVCTECTNTTPCCWRCDPYHGHRKHTKHVKRLATKDEVDGRVLKWCTECKAETVQLVCVDDPADTTSTPVCADCLNARQLANSSFRPASEADFYRIPPHLVSKLRTLLIGTSPKQLPLPHAAIQTEVDPTVRTDIARALADILGQMKPQSGQGQGRGDIYTSRTHDNPSSKGFLHEAYPMLMEALRMRTQLADILGDASLSQLNPLSSSDIYAELFRLCSSDMDLENLISALIRCDHPIPIGMPLLDASTGKEVKYQSLVQCLSRVLMNESPTLLSLSLNSGPGKQASTLLNNMFFPLGARQPGSRGGFERNIDAGLHHDSLVEMLVHHPDHDRGYNIIDMHGLALKNPLARPLAKCSSAILLHIDASASSKSLVDAAEFVSKLPSKVPLVFLVYADKADDVERVENAMASVKKTRSSLPAFVRLVRTKLSQWRGDLHDLYRRIWEPIRTSLESQQSQQQLAALNAAVAPNEAVSPTVATKPNFFAKFKPSKRAEELFTSSKEKGFEATNALMAVIELQWQSCKGDAVAFKKSIFPLSAIARKIYELEVQKQRAVSLEQRDKDKVAATDFWNGRIAPVQADLRKHTQCHKCITLFVRMLVNSDPQLCLIFGRKLTAWSAGRTAHARAKLVELTEKLDKQRKSWLELCEKKQASGSFVAPPELTAEIARWRDQLDAATISLGHFSRELIERQKHQNDVECGKAATSLTSICLLHGSGTELLDGDTMQLNSPSFTELVNHCKSDKSLKVVVVLGAQSSGKSTLMNVVFDLAFGVSAGKCTNGLHGCQSVSQDGSKRIVIDSEGLLSPERGDQMFDKKLALFAFAIASQIVLNVNGEALDDVRSLLEMLTYAFKQLSYVTTTHRPELFIVNRNVDTASSTNDVHRQRMEKILGDADYKLTDFVTYDANRNLLKFASAYTQTNIMGWSSRIVLSNEPNAVFYKAAMQLRRMLVSSSADMSAPSSPRGGSAIILPGSTQWRRQAEYMWDTWIRRNIDLLDFKYVAQVEQHRALSQAFTMSSIAVIEQGIRQVIQRFITHMSESIRSSSRKLCSWSWNPSHFNLLQLPENLCQELEPKTRVIMKAAEVPAELPSAMALMDTLLDYYLAAPDNPALIATSSFNDALSYGHWMLPTTFLDTLKETGNVQIPEEMWKPFLQRCIADLHDERLRLKEVARIEFEEALGTRQLDALETQALREIVKWCRDNHTSVKDSMNEVNARCDAAGKIMEDKWLARNLPPDPAVLWKELIDLCKKLAPTYPDCGWRDINDRPSTGDPCETVLWWHMSQRPSPDVPILKLSNVAQWVLFESPASSLHAPVIAAMRKMMGDEVHNLAWQDLHTAAFLEHATDAILSGLNANAKNTADHYSSVMNTRVTTMFSVVKKLFTDSQKTAKENTHFVKRFLSKFSRQTGTTKPAGPAVSLVYRLLLRMIFDEVVRVASLEHQARVTQMKKTIADKIDSAKVQVQLIAKSEGLIDGVCEEIANGIATTTREAHKKALFDKFSPASVPLKHKRTQLVDEFYKDVLTRGKWPIFFEFIKDQRSTTGKHETVKSWFRDGLFAADFELAIDTAMQSLRTSLDIASQSLVAIAIEWSKRVTAALHSQDDVAPEAIVFFNFVHFAKTGTFPTKSLSGSMDGDATSGWELTEMLDLSKLNTEMLTATSVPYNTTMLGIATDRHVPITATCSAITNHITKYLPAMTPGSIATSAERVDIFEKYFDACMGSCRSRCPFCGVLCTSDHSSTNDKHSSHKHFILSLAGWHDKHTKIARTYSCCEPVRAQGKYYRDEKPSTFDEIVNMDAWHIPMTAQEDITRNDMERAIRCSYVYLIKDLAKLFHYKEELPDKWREIYAPESTAPPEYGVSVAKPLFRQGRVLALDGGGLRGILLLKQLVALEKATGRPAHQMFDLIVGTSAGAIVAGAIGLLHWPAERCLALLTEIAAAIFPTQPTLTSGFNLLSDGGRYDPQPLIQVLKHYFGATKKLSEFCNGPKVAIVAAWASTDAQVKPYLFRNYQPGESVTTESLSVPYNGCSSVPAWLAILASAAAPSYFPPVQISINGFDHVFVDGGVVANNPAQIGLHEAELLFKPPNTARAVHTLVSLGTGAALFRPHPSADKPQYGAFDMLGTVFSIGKDFVTGNFASALFTGVKELVGFKAKKVLHDAVSNINPGMIINTLTSGEYVHSNIKNLAGNDSWYIRFNPTGLGDPDMANSKPEALALLDFIADVYIKDQQIPIRNAAERLLASSFEFVCGAIASPGVPITAVVKHVLHLNQPLTSFKVRCRELGDSEWNTVPVDSNRPGAVELKFSATGTYDVSVQANGQDVVNSPYRILCKSGGVSASHCKLIDVNDLQLSGKITLSLCDSTGSRVTEKQRGNSTGLLVTASFEAKSLNGQTRSAAVGAEPVKDATGAISQYLLHYSFPPECLGGEATIVVHVNGVALLQGPMKTFIK